MNSESVQRGEEPWRREELLRRVGADHVVFPPGHGWAYSNVGYLLVRGLLEEVTGEELGAALRRLVFEPLGVPGVRIATEPRDLDGTAWGHAAGYHPGWVYHGLAVGTPAEAALFLHRLMTGGLVPGELLADMRTRGVKITEPSDPLHDSDFIQALMHTYDVAVTTDWLTEGHPDNPSDQVVPEGKS